MRRRHLDSAARPGSLGDANRSAEFYKNKSRSGVENYFIKREKCFLFNDTLNTFYLRLYGIRHMVKDHSDSEKEREREMFYLMTHSTHFIYGYMASDIWLRTILIVRKETRCRQQGLFYMHHPTERITHTTVFVTPVVEHWLEREIAQCIL